MLNRLCANRRYSRAVALRELLEGALFRFPNLFGVHDEADDGAEECEQDDRLLMHANQMQNIAPNIMRASLHAGTIGSGAKPPAREPSKPKPEFRDMLLKAFLACCRQDVCKIKQIMFGFIFIFL